MLRRFLLVGIVAVLPSTAPAQQQQRSHDHPLGPELNYFRRAQPDRVPLLTADGAGIEVTQVLIHLGDRVLGVSTEAGVDARSENRVRLRGIPILGALFFDRFSQADIAPGKRIGTVYRHDGTLYVEIDRNQPAHPITQVVILNQDNAYFLAGAPQPARVEGDPYAVYAGKAFIKDGETLLLLVEPSVIQHNIFDTLF